MEQLRYAPRARFCGNVEWLCAFCGTINKNRLDYTSWSETAECKAFSSASFFSGVKWEQMQIL